MDNINIEIIKKISASCTNAFANHLENCDEDTKISLSNFIGLIESGRSDIDFDDKISLDNRSELYAIKIAKYIEKNKDIPKDIEGFLNLYISAIFETENLQDKTSIISLEEEIVIDNIIDSAAKNIAKSIYEKNQPSLISMIKKSIKRSIESAENKKSLYNDVGIMLYHRKNLIKNISDNLQKMLVKSNFIARLLSLNKKHDSTKIINEKLIDKVIKKSMDSLRKDLRKENLFRNSITGMVKQFICKQILNKFQKNKVIVKLKKKQKQNFFKFGIDQLYDMINSHNPKHEAALPRFINNNVELKQIISELKNQGVSHVNACNNAKDKIKDKKEFVRQILEEKALSQIIR